MTQAHNATLTVSNEEITVTRSELSAALFRSADSAAESRVVSSIRINDITGISATEPTALNCGFVELQGVGTGSAPERIIFPPGESGTKALQAFISDVRDAQQGDAPADGAVAGLNFVAISVEAAPAGAANDSEPLIDTTVFSDGQAGESRSFSPAEFSQHVQENPALANGTTPLIAHNGFYHAALLQRAVPKATLHYGCTLALARDASARAVIEVADHSLKAVAQAVGVTAEQDSARTVGDVLVALALREHHRGSVADLFGAADFALGELHDGTHRPVLRTDLSHKPGGGTAGANSSGNDSDAHGTAADQPSQQPSSTSKKSGKSGQPAPWQAVATPDTVPEANDDADSHHPLFGQHVTLTGEFEPYDKGRLWDDIAARGAQIGKNVTKKTTILVVGEWAKKTSKEKRAEELNEKGQGIEIWPASKLFAALGLDEQPPF